MKKTLSIILTTMFLIASLNILVNADNTIEPAVYLNDERIFFEDVQPVIVDGRTLVPLRGVFEKMHCTVTWIEDERRVKIERETLIAALIIDNPTYGIGIKNLDGSIRSSRSETLDVAPRIIEGRTMVPLRVVSESLGAQVDWIDSTKSVFIRDESLHPDYVSNPSDNPVIQWTDEGVEAGVRDMLAKPYGDITLEECEDITYLDLTGYTVRRLNDLVFLPYLESLYISDARRIDLDYIRTLTNLRNLSICGCDISDLSPLSSLNDLESLTLDNNKIEDLTPLSGLENVYELSLVNNRISDPSPLSSMSWLRYLYLSGNPITDISNIANLIINLDVIDIDEQNIETNMLTYHIPQEYDDFFDYINSRRIDEDYGYVSFNNPYACYFFTQIDEYFYDDENKNYIGMLQRIYGFYPEFKRTLPLDFLYTYNNNIVTWMNSEFPDVMNELLYSNIGYVVMYRQNDILVIQAASQY